MAGALNDLEAGILSELSKLNLQCPQELAATRLLADCEHGEWQVAERLGGAQLLSAHRPGPHLSSFGSSESRQCRARSQLSHLLRRQPGRDATREVERPQQPEPSQPAEESL